MAGGFPVPPADPHGEGVTADTLHPRAGGLQAAPQRNAIHGYGCEKAMNQRFFAGRWKMALREVSLPTGSHADRSLLLHHCPGAREYIHGTQTRAAGPSLGPTPKVRP